MTFDPRLKVVDLETLEQRVTALDYQKANSSTVGGLATRLNAAENDIASKAAAATVATLSATVANKADASAVSTALGQKADVAALAGKANVSDLALKADATALASKADVSALSTKADSAAVTSALATKADSAAVAALSSTVSGKADQAALTTLAATVSGKADATAVTSLSTALSGKASQAALDAVASSVPALATVAPPAAAQNSAVGAAVSAAREDHTHKLRYKRVPLVTNGSGQVSVVWSEPFATVPVMNDPSIMDPAGGRYTCTCLANSAAGCTYQISKARTLPAVLTLLSQLLGYDTWQPAPAGLTVYVSGAEATQ